ncbi:MAG TPA: hypothetical protein VD866_29310 [Urbifossiella sp.]|nr:hypothetical protein [Urbifossiella sp.]
MELCPFPGQTSTGRADPCPTHTGRCAYAQFCHDEWHRPGEEHGTRVGRIFEASYHSGVTVTLAEPSGSFVLRSDLHYLGREMFRMPVRRHLYEVLTGPAPGGPGAGSPHRCPGLAADTRLGLYIGFVDLRRNYVHGPLAFGLLAVPRKLSVDPDAHIIVGNYGPLFGGPAMSGTVYAMQDDQTTGAACAQACVIMVLGMLADRGARLEGSYTLTQLGYSGDGKDDQPEGVSDEDWQRVTDDPDIATAFSATYGLRPWRIERVLRHLRVGAEVVALRREVYAAGEPAEGDADELARRTLRTTGDQRTDEAALEKLALRMIECHVQARYPVILGVDAEAWTRQKQKEKVGHAVTVVGVRKASLQNREPHLIIHDPARQPYFEMAATRCFATCWKYRTDRSLVLIMSTEWGVRSLHSCWTYLKEHEFYTLARYVYGRGLRPEVPFDYQFSLVYKKDVHTFLWPVPLRTPERQELDAQLGLAADRYWCVAGYEARHLEVVWLFPTAGEPGDPWEVRLDWDSSRHLRLTWYPGGHQTLALPAVLHEAFRHLRGE